MAFGTFPHEWGPPVEQIVRCVRCGGLSYSYGEYLSSDVHNCPVPPGEVAEWLPPPAKQEIGAEKPVNAGALGAGVGTLVMAGADERGEVKAALDKLAVALTDTGHVWTAEERAAYERAIALLGGS